MLKIILPSFIFILMAKIILAGTTTVELQNGINNYSGCVDSYLLPDVVEPKGAEEKVIGAYG